MAAVKIIGITGGIGVGKSIVSKALRAMNFPVYDSDSEAKRLMNVSEEIKSALVSHFGDNVYNSSGLDRKFLADKIFNNESERLFINGVVHPAVCSDFIMWAKSQESEFVFIESAILFECDLCRHIDAAIYVDANQDERIVRVAKRDNTDARHVMARIKAQVPHALNAKAKSEYHIDNSNGVAILPQIEKILTDMRKKK